MRFLRFTFQQETFLVPKMWGLDHNSCSVFFLSDTVLLKVMISSIFTSYVSILPERASDALDHTLIRKGDITIFGQTRVYGGAKADTEHRLLVSKLYFQPMRSTGPPKKEVKKRTKVLKLKQEAKKELKVEGRIKKHNGGKVVHHQRQSIFNCRS